MRVKATEYTSCDDLEMQNVPPGSFCYTGVYGKDKNFIGGMIMKCPCGCGSLGALSFDNSTQDSPKWHWDNNKENPTLFPSIWRKRTCGWHGFLRNGFFESV